MSISSIISNGAAPANTVGPTLNAKDPVNDPVIGDPAAVVSISGPARQLSGRQRGRNPHTTDAPAPSRGRNPRTTDAPAPSRGRNPRTAGPPASAPSAVPAAVSSAVTSAIAAYRQASVRPAP